MFFWSCIDVCYLQQTEGRKTRPQDLTRLYEIILQNLSELQQLAGLEEDQEYQRDIQAKIQAYRAFRSVITPLSQYVEKHDFWI